MATEVRNVAFRRNNIFLLTLQMVAAGYSAARVRSFRTHEALSLNVGVFIDLVFRNWNLTWCSVSGTGKGPPGHGDKRHRLSRRLYSWAGLRTLRSSFPLRENKSGNT
jgi:hypothetical protein